MSDNERYPMQAEECSFNSPVACGAKTRTGNACKNNPVTGKNRCRMHGGGSPSGKDHWNYQHGYWSKEEKQLRAQSMRIMKMCLKNAIMW